MRTSILLASALLYYGYGKPAPTWFVVVFIVFFLISCTVDAFYLVLNLLGAEEMLKKTSKPKPEKNAGN